jgi:hypothetical protein
MLGAYSTALWKVLKREYRYVWTTPPNNRTALYKLFGKYSYRNLENGFVEVIGDWEKNNIIDLTLPVRNNAKDKHWKIRCHKVLETGLFSLFSDYVAKGYDQSYPIHQLGCYVPRHKMCDPTRSLSIHAWGAAIDINWRTNRIGTRGDMPMGVVTLFKQYGFNWGGFWTRPKDPMHFQFYSGS